MKEKVIIITSRNEECTRVNIKIKMLTPNFDNLVVFDSLWQSGRYSPILLNLFKVSFFTPLEQLQISLLKAFWTLYFQFGVSNVSRPQVI